MGVFGQVNFDNPSEKDEFNIIMEQWMNRQALAYNRSHPLLLFNLII